MKHLLFLSVLSLLLASCGSDDEVRIEEVIVEKITEAPADIEIRKEVVTYDCSDELEEVTLNLTIPKSDKTCDWNEDGNLGKKNSYTRARKETPIYFVLPNYDTICGLEITSEKEQFKYDDHIYLTLNNSLLFTSYPKHVEPLMIEGSDIPQFDWELLKGTHFGNGDRERFCLGSEKGSECVVPQTQQTGQMQLKIVDEIIQEVVALNIDRDTHVLNFIVSGDNDGSDCKHSEINLELKVKVPAGQLAQ